MIIIHSKYYSVVFNTLFGAEFETKIYTQRLGVAQLGIKIFQKSSCNTFYLDTSAVIEELVSELTIGSSYFIVVY